MDAAAENAALRAALAASEQRLAALAEASPVGVYRCDASGVPTDTNARWQQIFGLDGRAGPGHAWLQALHPGDRDRVTAAWHDAMHAGRDVDLEFRTVRPDGSERTVRSRARPLAAGDPSAGFVGAVEDVTEQRQNEQRLRASEAFLERTGRLAGIGGWQVDLLAGTVSWSDKTRALHEVDADYQPTLDAGIAFYAPEARPQVLAAVQEALACGKPWDLELPFVTARGRALWVRTFGEVEYRDGQAVRLTGAFQDITEHRARQRALEQEHALRLQSERHARELDRLLAERGEMLDVLAHEVRQPLNNASAAMQSASAALRDAGDAAAAQRVLRAQTVLLQVLASIDNTLAVAALLARAGPIGQGDTDIDTLLTVAITDLPPAERQRIRIERLTRTRTASMDMGLMRLALRNLLSNALKYSPPGSAVEVRLADSDEPLALVIDVADAGGAIPADVLPRLFMRGARGSHAGVPAGHGLGLYIVQRVMEMHGGRVEVTRNSAAGVTFRLWLDQAPE